MSDVGRDFLISLFVFSFLSFELLGQKASVPPSIWITKEQRAVFSDFRAAEYRITYDTIHEKVHVKTQIEFDTFQEGKLLFDLVEEPAKILLDGDDVKSSVVEIGEKTTKMRMLEKSCFSGRHILLIEHEIAEKVRFQSGGAASAFWTDDRLDRHLLEQYLPTNLEYDQYAMTAYINFEGSGPDQVLWTNGEVTKTDGRQFKIVWPRTSTSASIYFHLGLEDEFISTNGEFTRTDGRALPITVYSKREGNLKIDSYIDQVKVELKKLEDTFGIFPHSRLLIYMVPDFVGESDYPGALMTSEKSLIHALAHQYFGHALQAAGGNSRWIFEGIVAWKEKEYPKVNRLIFDSENFVSEWAFRRQMVSSGYDRSGDLMAHFDSLVFTETGGKKGLMDVIRHSLKTRLFKPMTVEQFREDLEKVSGKSFEKEFKKWVYKGEVSKNQNIFGGSIERRVKSVHHPVRQKTKDDEDFFGKYL